MIVSYDSSIYEAANAAQGRFAMFREAGIDPKRAERVHHP